MDKTELTSIYEGLDFEMEKIHDNLKIPLSTPSIINFEEEIHASEVVLPEEITENSPDCIVWIDSYYRSNEETDLFYFRADGVYESREKFQLKIDSNGIRVFPLSQNFSLEAFKGIVRYVEKSLDVILESNSRPN